MDRKWFRFFKEIVINKNKLKMKKKASELEFIGLIKPDGSNIEKLSKRYIKGLFNLPKFENEEFELRCLSIHNKTFIASGMNTYVVRLKERDISPIHNILPLEAKKLNNEDFLRWFNYQIEIAKQ